MSKKNLESKSIHVFDDFLNNHESQFTTEFFSKDAKWMYGHNSYPGHNTRWFIYNLCDKPFFTEYLLTKINKLVNCNLELVKDIKNYVYANGQTIMLDGGWHKDRSGANTENYWTALLYVSDITPDNIDVINGHTEFEIDGKIQSIEPYKNRLVLFKSNITHRARAPSIPGMFRISVAWKLKKRG